MACAYRKHHPLRADVAWLDEKTVAIGGIGDDDAEMVDGARVLTLH